MESPGHKMEFDIPKTREEVWDYLEKEKKYFGYHPAGYGGWIQQDPNNQLIWYYYHYNTCD